jgi:hypothetical protein
MGKLWSTVLPFDVIWTPEVTALNSRTPEIPFSDPNEGNVADTVVGTCVVFCPSVVLRPCVALTF